jgi:hypothetical protein
MDPPGEPILVVVASIHMKHSEGRSGGGFLNNSSCLGVSRNLSTTGNLVIRRASAWWASARLAMVLSRAKEKQVNIPAPIRRAGGDLKAKSEASDVTGTRERDFPSLLRGSTALVSMHCAENQATDP